MFSKLTLEKIEPNFDYIYNHSILLTSMDLLLNYAGWKSG